MSIRVILFDRNDARLKASGFAERRADLGTFDGVTMQYDHLYAVGSDGIPGALLAVYSEGDSYDGAYDGWRCAWDSERRRYSDIAFDCEAMPA